jgi:hypothetical protein
MGLRLKKMTGIAPNSDLGQIYPVLDQLDFLCYRC